MDDLSQNGEDVEHDTVNGLVILVFDGFSLPVEMFDDCFDQFWMLQYDVFRVDPELF